MNNTKVNGLLVEYNDDYFIIHSANQIKNKEKIEIILNILQDKEIIKNSSKIKSYIKKWKRYNRLKIFKKYKFKNQKKGF